MQALAQETRAKFRAALADDLNTAEARAAIFEMVRAVNARADAGQFFAEDVPEILEALREFDQVFAVLEDHDAEWTKFTLDWAEREGKLDQAAPEVLATRGVTRREDPGAGGGAGPGEAAAGFQAGGRDPERAVGDGDFAGGLERGNAVEAEVTIREELAWIEANRLKYDGQWVALRGGVCWRLAGMLQKSSLRFEALLHLRLSFRFRQKSYVSRGGEVTGQGSKGKPATGSVSATLSKTATRGLTLGMTA